MENKSNLLGILSKSSIVLVGVGLFSNLNHRYDPFGFYAAVEDAELRVEFVDQFNQNRPESVSGIFYYEYPVGSNHDFGDGVEGEVLMSSSSSKFDGLLNSSNIEEYVKGRGVSDLNYDYLITSQIHVYSSAFRTSFSYADFRNLLDHEIAHADLHYYGFEGLGFPFGVEVISKDGEILPNSYNIVTELYACKIEFQKAGPNVSDSVKKNTRKLYRHYLSKFNDLDLPVESKKKVLDFLEIL